MCKLVGEWVPCTRVGHTEPVSVVHQVGVFISGSGHTPHQLLTKQPLWVTLFLSSGETAGDKTESLESWEAG